MSPIRLIIVLLLAGLTGATVIWLLVRGGTSDQSPTHQVAVTVPQLSGAAASGKVVFDRNCVACHGANAGGGPGGPPLVHKIYEPGHHADISFVLAVKNGVRQHHWSFGSMPPIPGVSEAEVEQIIAYVRTLQRANGIR